MERRLTPILAVTIGLVLISGLAYAVEKKRHAKPVDRTPETMTEEEALRAELLDTTEEHHDKKTGDRRCPRRALTAGLMQSRSS